MEGSQRVQHLHRNNHAFRWLSQRQYSSRDPSAETLYLVFTEKEAFPNIVPVFEEVDEGIYLVTNVRRHPEYSSG